MVSIYFQGFCILRLSSAAKLMLSAHETVFFYVFRAWCLLFFPRWKTSGMPVTTPAQVRLPACFPAWYQLHIFRQCSHLVPRDGARVRFLAKHQCENIFFFKYPTPKFGLCALARVQGRDPVLRH